MTQAWQDFQAQKSYVFNLTYILNVPLPYCCTSSFHTVYMKNYVGTVTFWNRNPGSALDPYSNPQCSQCQIRDTRGSKIKYLLADLTVGGLLGYSSVNSMVSLNVPSSNGVSCGPNITAFHSIMLLSLGAPLTPATILFFKWWINITCKNSNFFSACIVNRRD